MKIISILAALTVLTHAEPKSLFNGKDLTGWDGNPEFWSVQEGVITGQTTAEKPTSGNTFLIWKDGSVADFELTLKYKTTPGDSTKFANSGIQYRSQVVDAAQWIVSGYQADLEFGRTYSGILYEERGRGILANLGQKTKLTQSSDPAKPSIEVVGEAGKPQEILAAIQPGGWNEYRIVAKGNHLQHFINGKLTVEVTDETAEGAKSGILALQLHQGAPMKVQFKDIIFTAN
jgi:Domain of Unknown Function (DUF1080)